jgi:hypothetical protein
VNVSQLNLHFVCLFIVILPLSLSCPSSLPTQTSQARVETITTGVWGVLLHSICLVHVFSLPLFLSLSILPSLLPQSVIPISSSLFSLHPSFLSLPLSAPSCYALSGLAIAQTSNISTVPPHTGTRMGSGYSAESSSTLPQVCCVLCVLFC